MKKISIHNFSDASVISKMILFWLTNSLKRIIYKKNSKLSHLRMENVLPFLLKKELK